MSDIIFPSWMVPKTKISKMDKIRLLFAKEQTSIDMGKDAGETCFVKFKVIGDKFFITECGKIAPKCGKTS